jgi:hypothetical protein
VARPAFITSRAIRDGAVFPVQTALSRYLYEPFDTRPVLLNGAGTAFWDTGANVFNQIHTPNAIWVFTPLNAATSVPAPIWDAVNGTGLVFQPLVSQGFYLTPHSLPSATLTYDSTARRRLTYVPGVEAFFLECVFTMSGLTTGSMGGGFQRWDNPTATATQFSTFSVNTVPTMSFFESSAGSAVDQVSRPSLSYTQGVQTRVRIEIRDRFSKWFWQTVLYDRTTGTLGSASIRTPLQAAVPMRPQIRIQTSTGTIRLQSFECGLLP